MWCSRKQIYDEEEEEEEDDEVLPRVSQHYLYFYVNMDDYY